MPKTVAIHLTNSRVEYVVASAGTIEATGAVTVPAGTAWSTVGKQLADALTPHRVGRANVIVGLPRESFQWQHLSLPPCPTDELTDLVYLQADREMAQTAEDQLGFDYLPLVGDEQTPYRVLTVELERAEIDRVRKFCSAANLAVERIAPLALGWPMLPSGSNQAPTTDSQVFVAPLGQVATIWAKHADDLVLFRQFQRPHSDDPAALPDCLVRELRRTLLALAQDSAGLDTTITLVGSDANQLATYSQALDEKVEPTVTWTDAKSLIPDFENSDLSLDSALPLAGLALSESNGMVQLVDLLHPRRRPRAQVNYRTYTLAGVATALLVAALGWSAYTSLNAPLLQADRDTAELQQLEESSESLAQAERNAAAIRDWLADSPNLLLHLQQISRKVRPASLQDPNFSSEHDIALEKLNLEKRQLVLDAVARDAKAMQPLESRLRETSYTAQRGSSSLGKAKDYPWQFKSIIDVTTASDQATTKLSAPDDASLPVSEEPAS